MLYKFRCDKCNTYIERSIPIDKYDEMKNKQKCNSCGSKLERVIEFDGSVSLCNGMYGTNNGGWNA